MILYQLRCVEGHGFEAWFRDGETYDRQSAAGEVTCPVCGCCEVSKAPMAPRVARSRSGEESVRKTWSAMQQSLRELRRHVEANCENVGDGFAEEARKIHYGEVERRNIYGDATEEETKQLDEEGIEIQRIPWPARHDS